MIKSLPRFNLTFLKIILIWYIELCQDLIPKWKEKYQLICPLSDSWIFPSTIAPGETLFLLVSHLEANSFSNRSPTAHWWRTVQDTLGRTVPPRTDASSGGRFHEWTWKSPEDDWQVAETRGKCRHKNRATSRRAVSALSQALQKHDVSPLIILYPGQIRPPRCFLPRRRPLSDYASSRVLRYASLIR